MDSNVSNMSKKLAFALDFPTLATALPVAQELAPVCGVLKIGLELYLREGREGVKQLQKTGSAIFLDLKLHDIPATVGRAVSNAADLGVNYLTLHSLGGSRMLEAAVKAAQAYPELKLLAVTVLTSMDKEDLTGIGINSEIELQVQRLAKLSLDVGVHGLVCSAHEAESLRIAHGTSPILVTPGIRLASSDEAISDDQRRIMTPSEAIRAGSSLLVIGRPIRDAADRLKTATQIAAEIATAELA